MWAATLFALSSLPGLPTGPRLLRSDKGNCLSSQITPQFDNTEIEITCEFREYRSNEAVYPVLSILFRQTLLFALFQTFKWYWKVNGTAANFQMTRRSELLQRHDLLSLTRRRLAAELLQNINKYEKVNLSGILLNYALKLIRQLLMRGRVVGLTSRTGCHIFSIRRNFYEFTYCM